MKYYLGIDNGGTTTKAALYTQFGDEVGVASISTKALIPKPNFVERDMVEMWQDNCRVIRKLLEDTSVDPADIACIACCGHGKGLYLWGKDGKPAYHGILSADNRAVNYANKWLTDGTLQRIYGKTCQSIMACQPVSILAWIKDHEPLLLDRVQWIFACKDYIRFCLTGEAYGEITDFSGCNLINLYSRSYDIEILQDLGLTEIYDKLPPLKSSTELCGHVSASAAMQTGLKQGTPVAGGMFDIDACALAVGVVDEAHVCMIAGTWSINEYIQKKPVTDGSVLMNSIFCMPEYYLIEESSPTSAGNNEWFINILLPELREEANLQGKSIYDITNDWVASIPPEEFCPIFTPFLMASNVNPNAKASFIGMSNYHTRAHLMRSVYEGIAFCHRCHFEKLMRNREHPLESIRLAGGVARSKQWVQMFASIMGYPVEVVEVNETGTLGCAIAAAVATGDYPDLATAILHMTKVTHRTEPNPAHKEIYDKKYHLYCRILDILDPIWDEMKQMY